jgi:glycosyltransferase involved in cell wall biosynthesis
VILFFVVLFLQKLEKGGVLGVLPDPRRRHVLQRVAMLDHDMSPETMAALYNAADAYVSPYISEAFNMPVLEAMACGVPVGS